MISGADGWTSIALYGEKKLQFLRRFLPFKHGTPSHDQLGILFSRLDMESLPALLHIGRQHALDNAWIADLHEMLEGVVAVDGKTLRRSFDLSNAPLEFDTGSKRAAIHMISAFACDQQLILGQRKVDDRSNARWRSTSPTRSRPFPSCWLCWRSRARS